MREAPKANRVTAAEGANITTADTLDIYSVSAQTVRNGPELSSIVVELGEKHSPADLKEFLLPAVRLLYEIHKERDVQSNIYHNPEGGIR